MIKASACQRELWNEEPFCSFGLQCLCC